MFGNPQSKYIVCTSTITAALKYFTRAVGTFRSEGTVASPFYFRFIDPTDYRHTKTKFFAVQIQIQIPIPIPNKYLGCGYKSLAF